MVPPAGGRPPGGVMQENGDIPPSGGRAEHRSVLERSGRYRQELRSPLRDRRLPGLVPHIAAGSAMNQKRRLSCEKGS